MSKSFAMQLNPATPALGASATSLAFGNVSVGAAVTKSVTRTSSSTAPVTVSADSISGAESSATGGSLPAAPNPGQAALLTVQSSPTASSVTGNAPAETAESQAAKIRTTFHVRYINGSNVYIDGGRDAALNAGMQMVVKQDPTKPADDPSNASLEPGVVAKLTVVAVASTSAVCEVNAKGRELVVGDEVTLTNADVENIVQRDTVGDTRKYPIVISFSEGDPLDEEVRNAIPRPPLPEVNQLRGRIGFDMSTIQQLEQGGASSKEYGMVVRVDFTRMFGSHWNLNGYWRGERQTGSSSTATLQDLLNRTYLISLTYVNPESRWTAGIGRLYLPWASSLDILDGIYLARKVTSSTLFGVFAGSTPDPTAWNYDPQRRIGGALFNAHGGDFDRFRFSTTFGAGIQLYHWTTNRPFAFTQNEFSYKRYINIFEAMQVDRPTPNPGSAPVGTGIGESLVSMRVQIHPRVSLDVSDTYFRDVPTYVPALVGTGLLNQYLYQGVNGGARIVFPLHLTGYFSLGQSSNSSDTKSSLNELFGLILANIWKTGLEANVQYSKFNSSFASGSYRNISLIRNMGERIRLNLQVGKYAYSSTLAATNNSYFANVLCDTNLGARFFVEGNFTTQRGGTTNYNQWTTVLGYRFDNRSRSRREVHGNLP
jgi:hypothetical protein